MRTRKLGALAMSMALLAATEAESRAGKCIDPTLCSSNNGTGVYFQEGGIAALDTSEYFMITSFTNHGSGSTGYVTFSGRYYDAAALDFVTLSNGSVAYAEYDGVKYDVARVGEYSWYSPTYATYPYWQLVSGNQTIYVQDSDLTKMALHLSYTDLNGGKKLFVLKFDSATAEEGTSAKNPTKVFEYSVISYPANDPNKAGYQYCQGYDTKSGERVADYVVFQGGIDVDPRTGVVHQNANDVTFSCRRGAPATAYWWGYNYFGDASAIYRFGAANQMKRASYCGDYQYHTVAGTAINLLDDAQIQNDLNNQIHPFNDKTVEAYWSPTGAICYDQPRRSDLKGQVQQNGMPLLFQQDCVNASGQPYTVPACDSVAGPYGSLAAAQQSGWLFVVDGVIWPQ